MSEFKEMSRQELLQKIGETDRRAVYIFAMKLSGWIKANPLSSSDEEYAGDYEKRKSEAARKMWQEAVEEEKEGEKSKNTTSCSL